ncbi:MAG: hypothetical protein EA389_03605 [Ilumatobacter sp.]|nr:MAG: hypothetical protein EA389_03605 [Ilumatobacter sp.]
MNTNRRPRVNRPPSRYAQSERAVPTPLPDVRPAAPPPRSYSQAREHVPPEIVPGETKVRATPPPARRPEPPPRPRRESSRSALRRALASPGAARNAFVLREVLGPPVSLRTDIEDRPS